MRWLKKNWLWMTAHAVAVAPLIWLLADFALGNLSINPIQDLTFRTGEAALRLLFLSLLCTPLHILFGWRWLLPLRKPLGLYAFMYVTLHFLIYVGLDYGFNLPLLWQEVSEKQYVFVGLTAYLLLIPLALTSNVWAMRQLGKNWKRLHRMVYGAAVLAVLHLLWARKLGLDPEALIYGVLLLLMLIVRLPRVRKAIITYRRNAKEERLPSHS